jgi:hypothetical protein
MSAKDHINKRKEWEPDHQYMIRKSLWTLREAANNLFNIAPEYVEDWQERYFEIIKLYEIMEIDINLSLLEIREYKVVAQKSERAVIPNVYIKWASGKGYPIPDAFKILLKGKRKGEDTISRKRIDAIKQKALNLGFNILAIPRGGKSRIGTELRHEQTVLFQNESSFTEAWKKASTGKELQVANIEDYTSGK